MKFRVIAGSLVLAVFAAVIIHWADIGSLKILSDLQAMSRSPEKEAESAESFKGFADLLDTPAMMSALAPKVALHAIARAGNRVLSAGGRGIIVYSDDAGATWTQAKVPVSVDLTALYFPSEQKGWAVGHDGLVLHSTDAGETWTKQLDGREACQIMKTCYRVKELPKEFDEAAAKRLRADIDFMIDQGPVNPFLDVWFKNDEEGFAVGAFNLIFHTTDGGKTWEPWFDRTDNPGGLHFYGIEPAGGDLFLSGEQGKVWKLDHASGRFKSIQTPYSGTLFGLVGTADAVYTFGQRGNLYRSRDGGGTWENVDSGVTATIFDGATTPAGNIVLVTQAGNVMMSKDGGMRFDEVRHEKGDIPQYAVTALENGMLAIAGMMGVHVESIE